MTRAAPLRAFFHAVAGDGQRLYIYHPPVRGMPASSILYVHPFGEEMNKSRRMAALQARALAAAGHAVLQIDLRGCGDSDGELADTTWSHWLDDVDRGIDWLRRETTAAPLRLWGLRAGCLLAACAARRSSIACDFLFWQPVLSGAVWIQQLTRLQRAARLSGTAVGRSDETRLPPDPQAPFEVAGYALAAALVADIGTAALQPPVAGGRLDWIELSQRPEAALLPASVPVIGRWREGGFDVRSRVVAGPAFWQTSEIEAAPLLLAASTAALAVDGKVLA